MGCNCGQTTPPEFDAPNCAQPDWEDIRWNEEWHHCDTPPKPIPPRDFNYFSDCTSLEKQIMAEQLGFAAGNVTVVNHPDGEDLTQSVEYGQKVLKFNDKEYDPLNFSGYGKVYLRKNLSTKIINGESTVVNILDQAMFQDKNGNLKDHTKFIIQYDYDLQGAFIQLPANSTIEFDGGSLSNGTLLLNNTMFYPNPIDFSKFTTNVELRNNLVKGQLVLEDDTLKLHLSDGAVKTLAFKE